MFNNFSGSDFFGLLCGKFGFDFAGVDILLLVGVYYLNIVRK